MQSVDEFTPSTTEPVFGSGLISQTKAQSSTNNDTSDTEKVNPSSEPVVNGQNDTTVNKVTSNDNVTNGTTETTTNESNGTTDSAVVHVNGQNEKPAVETNNEVEPAVIEKPNPVEPTIPQPVETVQESSSTIDTAPPAVEQPPPPTTTTTEAAVVNDSAPEAPVATESETTEVKSKTPRGRAKATVAATPTPTPTRQSARGRKPASTSNAEENQTVVDDTTAAAVVEPTTTTATESPQRTKRQAATVAKDAITADSSTVDDVTDQMEVATEGETEKVTPSAGRKRGAPKSTPNSAKKAKGKNSITATTDEDNNDDIEAGVKDVEITPKKAARTSANKKTPEPPSEEYARKLRPRK